ncbi:MAG: mucoidy inhibitor MuiA family protein [Bacteroidales bacterium]|nr:mucoidy inhibitor MuiA family protein [Bacteroidales bacterium]
MKKLLFFIGMLLCLPFLNATEIQSKITDVTVYQYGAKISHVAEMTITPGITEIVIGNLTSTIQQNTLQVNLRGGVVLLSASSRINYLNEQSSIRIMELKDSLEIVESMLNWNIKQQLVYSAEEKMIQTNNKLGSEQKGMTVMELQQLADFYRSRLTEIQKKQLSFEKENKKLEIEKRKLENQLKELQARDNKPTGEVVLSLSAEKAGKVVINFSYVSSAASWQPMYDIRAENPEKPVKMIYKANIVQNSGFDWNKVNLSISTGNPYIDNNRPVLHPWFIDFFVESPVVTGYGTMKKTAPAPMAMRNLALQEAEVPDEAPAIGYDVQVSQNQITTEYKIETLQNIPSDNKEHLVAMKEYELPAQFVYHTVPKLSNGVFLLAKVPDYGQFNLLPGQANLFFQGMYVGQSTINPATTADTLLVSLGRDNRISVQRDFIKDLTSKKTLGTNIKETKAVEILVRNNNVFPLQLEVLDQVPIAKNKDIEVELENSGSAQYTSTSGKLLWRLSLKGGETQKLQYTYSVKYPKDKKITGL